jgi:L-ectoine synthase
MIIRRLASVASADWGNGISRRFLFESDGMGFTLTDTVGRRGTTTKFEYPDHVEAVYCLEGTADLIDSDGVAHPIAPGTMYAPDQHDVHYLVIGPDQDLRAVCVFSPALKGLEIAGPLTLDAEAPES